MHKSRYSTSCKQFYMDTFGYLYICKIKNEGRGRGV